MLKFLLPATFLGLALVLSGCARIQAPPSPTQKAAVPLPSTENILLAEEPAGAKPVSEVKKAAGEKKIKDGDEVVVIGRIAAAKKPFTGKAAFTIADLTLHPCDDDGCGNYFCEFTSKEIAAASVLVKFVDDQGQTQPQDARDWLKVKELQTVVVKGKARCDAEGVLTSVEVAALHPRNEIAEVAGRKE